MFQGWTFVQGYDTPFARCQLRVTAAPTAALIGLSIKKKMNEWGTSNSVYHLHSSLFISGLRAATKTYSSAGSAPLSETAARHCWSLHKFWFVAASPCCFLPCQEPGAGSQRQGIRAYLSTGNACWLPSHELHSRPKCPSWWLQYWEAAGHTNVDFALHLW